MRNRKFLSVGRGWFKEGGRRRACVFVAPSHPAGSDFLSLPVAAVFPVDRNAEGSSIRHADRRGDAVPEALLPLIGWSPASGVAVAPEIWAAAGRAATALCDAIDWPGATETPRADEPAAARPAPRAGRAALYGLGNYAKVHVVPSIQRHLGLDRIAEIDPLQLPRIRRVEGARDGGLSKDRHASAPSLPSLQLLPVAWRVEPGSTVERLGSLRGSGRQPSAGGRARPFRG